MELCSTQMPGIVCVIEIEIKPQKGRDKSGLRHMAHVQRESCPALPSESDMGFHSIALNVAFNNAHSPSFCASLLCATQLSVALAFARLNLLCDLLSLFDSLHLSTSPFLHPPSPLLHSRQLTSRNVQSRRPTGHSGGAQRTHLTAALNHPCLTKATPQQEPLVLAMGC